MKHIFFILTILPIFLSAQMKTGIWRGVLHLNPEKNIQLPFNFELEKNKGKYALIIHNAEERILVDETFVEKDSFVFKMPIFDTEFRTRIIGDSVLRGTWINHTKKTNHTIDFSATYGDHKRFPFVPGKENPFYEGKWEVTFNKGMADSTKALAIFKSINHTNYIHGTFLTATGDYRYLEGIVHNGILFLSCFDGSHAFLFTAKNNGHDITQGEFYSGSTGYETWEGRRNENFELPDPEGLTYLKDPSTKVHFAFPNLKDSIVTLENERFKGKVVIIQIMGSWCPNCMDESAYLSKLYKQYQKKGLEIVALAYERTDDKTKAKNNIERLVKRFDIGYEILLTGLTGKGKASESLPFLNQVMAFPTTIILDRQHKVQSIYTGFNGPATGKTYEEYSMKMERLIQDLLLKR